MLEPPAFVPGEAPATVVPLRSRLPKRSMRVAAAAAAALIVVASLGVLRGDSTSPPVDIDSVVEQHTVRVSVDPVLTNFRVIPAVLPVPVEQP